MPVVDVAMFFYFVVIVLIMTRYPFSLWYCFYGDEIVQQIRIKRNKINRIYQSENIIKETRGILDTIRNMVLKTILLLRQLKQLTLSYFLLMK